MKFKQLRREHKDRDADALQRNRDLFAGGQVFGKNVARYLTKNEREPSEVYTRRCQVARDEYVNYCGPIGNYFASWLMTAPPTFKSDPADADAFYEQFKEDCDGDGTDLDHFLRQRFIDAIIDQRVFWQVSFPGPTAAQSLAEWRAQGAGRAVLRPVLASSIMNWKKDGDGYVWLTEHQVEDGLLEPDDEEEITTETWTIWRRDGEHRRYQVSYDRFHKPRPDDQIAEIEMAAAQGQIEGIPLVELELPPELWLMNLVASPQLANWRKRVGLSWAIDRTCYAMPVFNVKNRRKPPAMGAGYYLIMGVDETATYLAPPPDSYGVVQGYIAELKDEIHRVVNQMARGVENNAASVGRSGESKDADDKQTEIVLSGFGAHVRDAAERTVDMVSAGRGEDVSWTVGGLSSYHVTDVTTFVAAAVAAQGITIPSPTYKREIAKRTAFGQLPDLDEALHQKIDEEIEDAEDDLLVPPAPTPGAPLALPGKRPKPGVGGQPQDASAANGAPTKPTVQASDEVFRQPGPP